MRILTRYMLRAHFGPFCFALSVLTGTLYVNVIARALPDLAGKGLPASIWAKVLLLSLPHIVALTLPMAVLVAVLYAFSSLTAENEVTALKASGVNMLRLLFPVLIAGAVLTLVMIWFNDRLLPDTNHALKNLRSNIAARSPTFQLQEQTLEELRSNDFGQRLYLRAGRIYHGSGRLKDVTIWDVSDGQRSRTIYADSGRIGLGRDSVDLFLTLYSGEAFTVKNQTPDNFERVRFDIQRSMIKDFQRQIDLAAQDDYRSDREMSLGQLVMAADSTRAELRQALRQLRLQSETAVANTLSGPSWVTRPGAAALPPYLGGSAADLSPQYYASSYGADDPVVGQAGNEIRAYANRVEDLRKRINQYRVEYHKKYAIPFACIIFVLIGAPLAVRFPRGGAGMVIAISLTIFAIYYVSLIGGESLGDDGLIAPFVGPWAPNFGFGLLALWGLTRIGRETATTRGGDWDDLWRTTVRFLARPFRRRARAGAALAGGD
ncbi:MAG: YjgP/YjgQ family permease [Gemmatimonadetes bacterium]|nr:YjgP/YjgQ family permease [Gemmatimonadota bacterium]